MDYNEVSIERILLLEEILGSILIFILCRELCRFNAIISFIIVIIVNKYFNNQALQK